MSGTRTFLALAAFLLTALAGPRANGPKFFPDDPIARDPESLEASGVRPWEVSDGYDFVENSFFEPGDRADRRAENVNTLDEVPDSSWFTNRIGAREMTIEEIVRGPQSDATDNGPDQLQGPWTVVDGKSEGISPGLTLTDPTGQRYFIKFDPPSNPEMASGAEVISTKIFHALGYHVPENAVATLRRETLAIAEGATMRRPDGHQHRITGEDLDVLLAKAARHADGSYRMLASKALPGRPVGPFRYHGTRPDDPNDIFPHEHRRELRGMRVFASWLNHDEWRSSNSYDTLVERDGRTIVRHYLIDFGSTLGSGSVEAQRRRPGNEFLWEARPTFITMLTLGFYVRPWIKVDYPDIPAVGRIEADYYQPERWRPDYRNLAFLNARPDDTFWAARRVAALSEDAIRAIVKTARFSDPRAEDYLIDVILKRRDKVLRHWLTAVNPLVDFTLDASGVLTFQNAAVAAGVEKPNARYRVRWARFDNATGTATAAGGELTSIEPRMQAPTQLGSKSEFTFIQAEVAADHPYHPVWAKPVRVYFRRVAGGWKAVGLERMPE